MAHVQPYAYATQGLENKYQYNGKELNGDFGLDWYAYGFRYYDASIGRFTGVDPIASDFAFVSEYNYAENEPVANIDLHGLQKLNAKAIGYGTVEALNASGKAISTLFTAGATYVMDKVSDLLPEEGHPSPDAFENTNSVHYKGIGIEVLSDTELNANGTLDVNTAEGGSDATIGSSEIGTGGAGGTLGDAAGSATKFSKAIYNFGVALDQAANAKSSAANLPTSPVNEVGEIDTITVNGESYQRVKLSEGHTEFNPIDNQ